MNDDTQPLYILNRYVGVTKYRALGVAWLWILIRGQAGDTVQITDKAGTLVYEVRLSPKSHRYYYRRCFETHKGQWSRMSTACPEAVQTIRLEDLDL